jgi:hypothetical protein
LRSCTIPAACSEKGLGENKTKGEQNHEKSKNTHEKDRDRLGRGILLGLASVRGGVDRLRR